MKGRYSHLIALGALVALSGFILSGPVAFIIIHILRPQPAWESAAVFAEHYSSLQDIPFYFGFLLIGGMLMLVSGHYLNNRQEGIVKFHLLVALGWTIAFFTLIAFNYICQTTFVHNLALHYQPEYDLAIASFSMANPLSFCWANEMWGYAFLGVATWLMAGYYQSAFIRFLLIVNGVVSILSAVWTIIDVQWVMSPFGLIGYFLWNILMIVMMIAIYRSAKKPEP